MTQGDEHVTCYRDLRARYIGVDGKGLALVRHMCCKAKTKWYVIITPMRWELKQEVGTHAVPFVTAQAAIESFREAVKTRMLDGTLTNG
ncbi:unnamed protein product, partial [marine sediment metagenome]